MAGDPVDCQSKRSTVLVEACQLSVECVDEILTILRVWVFESTDGRLAVDEEHCSSCSGCRPYKIQP